MPRFWYILFLLFIGSLPIFSQTEDVYKRRIGMRLPNMLHYKPTAMEKRRIGMRLPNIIYLRSEPEKKDNWEYDSF
ncbi:hypothetical protein RB195_011173 [Necator americanus]|uniref:Uncharacterized protein n=2 Tax=Necator americanus TaxID=51031 RepID=W2T4Q2_NECAM|nr:hypothetical protein NECAME_11593 [Necator americanus]ETN76559.1 hypothetical protein NECAME_11593 [Necator americanus]